MHSLFYKFNGKKTLTLDVVLIAPQVPSHLAQDSYTLVVMALGGLEFIHSQTIAVKTKTLSLFVQTDKAMYKPGQEGNQSQPKLDPSQHVQ